MKAVFNLVSVEEDWQPPFQKKTSEEILEVEQDGFFGLMTEAMSNPDDKEYIFKLIQLKADRALIEFDYRYTLKEQKERPVTRQIWLQVGETQKFSSQWSHKGINRTITLNSVEFASAKPNLDSNEFESKVDEVLENSDVEDKVDRESEIL